jgi:ribosome-binding protein aMBF1 (putative translation factor)
MNEERPTTRHGFLSRMFSGNDVNEEEGTAVYSAEEVGVTGEEMVEQRGFTVERAAEVIKNLPPEVPRLSAVRIVRGTLEAAGINVADLATSTRARGSKLTSEIELSQSRIQELKEQTEEVIRSYELEIRKAREARDFGISEEERRMAGARSGLEDVERVRDFFGLQDDSETTSELGAEDLAGEETEAMERVDEDDTEILRRPGPLSEDYWDSGENRDR